MRDGVDAARSVPADAGDRAAPTPDGAPSGVLTRVRALLSERLLEAGLGPEGARTVLTLGFLAATSAIALVVLAESIAWGIVGVAQGDDVRGPVAWGAAAAIVRALAGWASGVVAERAAIGAKTYWRTSLATRLTRPLPAAGPGTGEAATLAGPGLDALDEYFTRVVPAAVQAAVVPAVLGLRILMDDWVSAIVVALTIPLVPFFMILIGKHTRDRVDEVTDELARLADHLVELARGLPVLVGLGRADEQAAALDGIQRRLRRRTNATLRQAFLSALALELIATISVAVVAVFLGVRLVNGTVELQPAIAALVLAPECYAAIRAVGTAFHQAQDGTSALRRVRNVLDAPDVPTGFVRTESSDAVMPVRVRELTVRRPGRSVDAVHGASVDARRGEIVAITGPSGAGKSTVLAAIAELLGPDALVHGTIAAPVAGELAYAPQDPTPFTSTPRAEFELAAGRPGASDAERAFASAVMLDALDLTSAADRDAAELSPGELRRVAVGRALLRVDAGARVLLLDEPTAHLDPVRAELVRQAIARRRGDVATVLVTHEPETLALADRRVAIVAAPAVPHGVAHASGGGPLEGPRTVLGVAARTPTVLETSMRSADGRAAPRLGPAESAVLDTALVDVEGEVPGSAADAEERDLAAATAGSGVADSGTTAVGASSDVSAGDGSASDAAAGPRVSALRALGLVLAPAAFRWTGAGVLGAIALAMSLGLAAVSGWLIVRASEQPAIMYLLVAIVGVRFFGIGRAVIRYVERLASHDAVLRSVDVLRIRLWRALARRGAAERSLLEPGRAVGLLVTRLGQVRDQAPRVVVPFAAGVLAIGAVVVAIALVTPSIAAPLCVALVATLVIAVVVALVADRAASSARAARQPLLTARAAALAAAGPVLRANGVADRAIDDVERVDADLASAQRRAAWAAGAAGAVAVGGTGVLAALTALAAAGNVPAALTAVVALLLLACADPVQGVVDAAQRAPALVTAARGLAPLLAREPRTARRAAVPAATAGDAPRDGLVLDALAARWPGTSRDVFADIDAEVRRGEWLVVEGPSGSGKSTLLTVLMGGLAPSRGEVVLDGLDLADADDATWRTRIAWCPQEAHVFDSTLRGNLLLARPRGDAPSEDEMRRVLERVGLGPLLESMPSGFDTRVGAGGRALSGGERQRVAVARTLLGDAEVLLLDEPTAHLDAPTAEALLDDLRAATRDRIVVLVTHRADGLRPEDHRILLGAEPAVAGGTRVDQPASAAG